MGLPRAWGESSRGAVLRASKAGGSGQRLCPALELAPAPTSCFEGGPAQLRAASRCRMWLRGTTGRTGTAQPRHGQLRSILHPLEVENSSLISTFVAK